MRAIELARRDGSSLPSGLRRSVPGQEGALRRDRRGHEPAARRLAPRWPHRRAPPSPRPSFRSGRARSTSSGLPSSGRAGASPASSLRARAISSRQPLLARRSRGVRAELRPERDRMGRPAPPPCLRARGRGACCRSPRRVPRRAPGARRGRPRPPSPGLRRGPRHLPEGGRGGAAIYQLREGIRPELSPSFADGSEFGCAAVSTTAVTRVPCPGAVSIFTFPPMADTRSVMLVNPVPTVAGLEPAPGVADCEGQCLRVGLSGDRDGGARAAVLDGVLQRFAAAEIESGFDRRGVSGRGPAGRVESGAARAWRPPTRPGKAPR